MKYFLVIVLFVLTANAALAQEEVTTDENDSPAVDQTFANNRLQEFLQAFRDQEKLLLSDLTTDIVKFSKSFQRRAKIMMAVKSHMLKTLHLFTDLERFGSMRTAILNMLTKMADQDNRTPDQLKAMISWIQKRKIDGQSADSHLDSAEGAFLSALQAFQKTQAPVIEAVNGIREATAAGTPFDQEKVRALITEVQHAADENRPNFLPSIAAAVNHLEDAVMHLRKRRIQDQ